MTQVLFGGATQAGDCDISFSLRDGCPHETLRFLVSIREDTSSEQFRANANDRTLNFLGGASTILWFRREACAEECFGQAFNSI